MSDTLFPLDEFHSRININTSNRPTLDRLESLQRAFIYAIPFENFDIQLGRGIDLSINTLIDKILRKKRGGYCFELNAILLTALETEGFIVRSILARVHLGEVPTGRSHQALLVTINGDDFLVDVGFGGGCPRIPMPLDNQTVSDHDGTIYRLTNSPLGTLVQRQLGDSSWQDLYSFDATPVIQSDIEVANYFTSTHPVSHFTNIRCAVKSHEGGENRLLNFRSTNSRNGETEILELPNSDGYLTALRDLYDIELDATYTELLPIK
jgi:N-hydroxyarylamine O-acetyltransferase